MPIAAKRPCRRGGCAVLVSGRDGHCDKHRRETIKAQKATVTEAYKERNRFYQRKAWKSVRAAHLASEPLCRSCRKTGKLIVATTVDHCLPIANGGMEYDDSNLQSLCKSCHNAKTLTETNVGRGASNLCR